MMFMFGLSVTLVVLLFMFSTEQNQGSMLNKLYFFCKFVRDVVQKMDWFLSFFCFESCS